MRVLLFHGRGIISTLIRWQTRSYYSHAAIQHPCGEIFEAWQGAGVRVATIKDWKGVHPFKVDVTDSQSARIYQFLEEQRGLGYDYMGVFGFVTRRSQKNNKKWFCSELVYAAFESAGIHLLRSSVKPWQVSPGMLANSPLLKPDEGNKP